MPYLELMNIWIRIDYFRLPSTLIGQGLKLGVCAEHIVKCENDATAYILCQNDLYPKWYMYFWTELKIPLIPNVFLFYLNNNKNEKMVCCL